MSDPIGWGRPTVASSLGSVSPSWSADLRSVIGNKPLGIVAGGKGHEYEYKPKTSLWFTDNNTVVATFVTRERTGTATLSRRDASDELSLLHLRAVFLNAVSGKIEAAPDWPAKSRFSSIVVAHDGKFVTQTGDELVLYSPDLKKIATLTLPSMDGSAWAEQFRLDGHPSPTGRRILFVAGEGSATKWILVDTDSLQILRSWEEAPLGKVSISDSGIVSTACTSWFYKCEPRIEIKGFDTDWKRIVPIDDRRHPGIVGFVKDDLFFILDRSLRLLRPDGGIVFAENNSLDGCWWGGVVPSAGGQRFVVPSCKLRGHVASLDLGGYDEPRKVLLYDTPFRERSYTLDVNGPRIKDMAQLALSPDGSKLAVLFEESVYLFPLPPVPPVESPDADTVSAKTGNLHTSTPVSPPRASPAMTRPPRIR